MTQIQVTESERVAQSARKMADAVARLSAALGRMTAAQKDMIDESREFCRATQSLGDSVGGLGETMTGYDAKLGALRGGVLGLGDQARGLARILDRVPQLSAQGMSVRGPSSQVAAA